MLPPFTLLTGSVGLALRLWLRSGMNEAGLYELRHPAVALIWLLTGIVLPTLLVVAMRVPRPRRRPSVLAGLGCFAGAVGLFGFGGVLLLQNGDTLTLIQSIFALVAGGSLIWQGILLWQGRPISSVLHLPVTIYFLLHAACQYRHWSSAAQLQSYIFPLFSSLALALASYHRAALSVRTGSWRYYVFFCQSAAFCCLLAASGESGLFYLAMGLWMLTGLRIAGPYRPRYRE